MSILFVPCFVEFAYMTSNNIQANSDRAQMPKITDIRL